MFNRPAVRNAVDREMAAALIDPINEAVAILAALPVPVLASLHGAVADAGMSLALACDLAIAADDVQFNLAYSHIGASPDVSASWTLPAHGRHAQGDGNRDAGGEHRCRGSTAA